jgi:dolichol-phosphate mannosyltransferase
MQASPRGLVSIILATYNEAENIADTVQAILRNVPDPVEVIVVDDDSPDGTWRIAGDLGEARVKVIRRTKARGLASAINRGLIESRGALVGWMDADMSHPPALLPAMLERACQCDVVIASRYAPGGSDDRTRARVLTSRLVNGLARLVLGYGICDYDSGYILMHRDVLDAVSLMPSGYGAYFIEFVYACCRKGLHVIEVPYRFSDRTKGASKSAANPLQFLLAGAGYVTRIVGARLRHLD